MPFDYAPHFRTGLPAAAGRWSGYPDFNFVGGHNDADSIPVAGLLAAAQAVIEREGEQLALYGLDSGPMGYRPLRDFIAAKLAKRAGMTVDPETVLVTSGSLQALDLVNAVFLAPGDTVVIEDACYGGTITRFQRLGVRYVGVPVDEDGMDTHALAATLDALKAEGVRPKFIYTIPTVQNPTGTVMTRERRLELLRLAAEHDLPIFEDDCYADLLWEGERPPALHALDTDGRVIYCGSFSKTVAPALRVGYLIAPWPVMGQAMPLKTDAGSGALEQMVLGEWAPNNFDAHVERLKGALRAKADATVAALEEQFGAAAEFLQPRGGIFLWVTLPDAVDTTRLAEAAAAEGVAVNPGAEWVADPDTGRHRIRICFAHPSAEDLRTGIAKLAEICHREFGVPMRSANVPR
ncbi:MAG: PLP-dependent aminotransferase family protein [Bauldia litoralis]